MVRLVGVEREFVGVERLLPYFHLFQKRRLVRINRRRELVEAAANSFLVTVYSNRHLLRSGDSVLEKIDQIPVVTGKVSTSLFWLIVFVRLMRQQVVRGH